MIIDIISDPHGHYPKLKGGDLLIVAGDLTAQHTKNEFYEFAEWYQAQNYKKKVIIAGNHDTLIENGEYHFNHDWMGYLCDSGTEFEGFKIWGSPWTCKFEGQNRNCMAFTVDSDEELEKKWDLIPDDIDILITHCPPYGILDQVKRIKGSEHVGSESLRYHVINRIKPKIHAFGHVHEHGGKMTDCILTKFVNASIINEKYKHVHKPVRIIL